MPQTLLVNPRQGKMPAAMKGKKMGLSKTSGSKPRKRRRPRKNPGGMFDQQFLKDSMWPLALGFAHEQLNVGGKFKAWDEMSNRNRMLLLVVAGAYMRMKGRADLHGACLVLAGQYAHKWQMDRQGAKSGTVAKAIGPSETAAEGGDTRGLSIQELYAMADREMDEVDVGAIYEDDDDDDVPVGDLGAIWQDDNQYAAA